MPREIQTPVRTQRGSKTTLNVSPHLVEAFSDKQWMYVVLERCYGDFCTRYGQKGSLGRYPDFAVVQKVTLQ